MSVDTDLSVLVVDDSQLVRKLVVDALHKMGIKDVHQAADGDIAWQMMTAGAKFNLIISDWKMERMSGLELLEKVRADERFEVIPFIMLTAETQRDNVVDAIQKGVTDFIIKPFDAVTISRRIERLYD
jgi:two-component system chemotaxis response regulator CheY